VAGPDRISFRALTRDDFGQLVDWLARPHVARWWTDPARPGQVEDEYGPCVDGTDPTRVFLILDHGRPVGMIQCYRLDDEPDYARAVAVEDAAGLDLFIGDADTMGNGFGSTVLRQFVDQVIWPGYPDLVRVVAGPDVANRRSQRAFEKAGFRRTRVVDVPGEPQPEQLMVLDRPAAPPTPTPTPTA
jgi:aminoglycoside 6'-N-acetyltransferase